MSTSFRFALHLGAAGLIGLGALAAKPAPTLPGLQLDGSVLLPNQWSLRPAGWVTVVGDFPVNVAQHPAGRFAAVLHSGWGQHEIRIIEIKGGKHRIVEVIPKEKTMFPPAGKFA